MGRERITTTVSVQKVNAALGAGSKYKIISARLAFSRREAQRRGARLCHVHLTSRKNIDDEVTMCSCLRKRPFADRRFSQLRTVLLFSICESLRLKTRHRETRQREEAISYLWIQRYARNFGSFPDTLVPPEKFRSRTGISSQSSICEHSKG